MIQCKHEVSKLKKSEKKTRLKSIQRTEKQSFTKHLKIINTHKHINPLAAALSEIGVFPLFSLICTD